MAPILTSLKLPNVLDFGANTTASTQVINLPRSKFIRRIRLNVTAAVSEVGSGANADFLRRVFSNIQVQGDNNTTYYYTPAEDVFQWNVRDYGTSVQVDSWGAGTIRGTFVLDFAVNSAVDSDVSALLPALIMQQLTLSMTSITTATAAGGSGSPATSSITVEVVVEEYNMSPDEALALYGSNFTGLRKIFNTIKKVEVRSANSNYNGQVDMQVGYVIKDVLVRTTDGTTGLPPTDGLVTAYRIEQFGTSGNFLYEDESWYSGKYKDILESGLPVASAITGSVSFNPQRNMGGLDARNLKLSDLQYRYNNSDTEFTLFLNTRNIVLPRV